MFDALKEEGETVTEEPEQSVEEFDPEQMSILEGVDPADSDIVGSIDLTDPDNLQVKTASLALTHRTQFKHIMTSPINDPLPEEAEMSTGEWKHIIDKLHAEGVENVVLTGGEPTIRPDFHTILQYAINHFENVTVQTNGTTNRNLSRYDCTVSLPLDYWEDIHNNEVRRVTDPENYIYHKNKGKLVPRENTKCGWCGDDFSTEDAAKSHIAQKHVEECLEEANEKLDEDFDSAQDIREHNKIGWGNWLDKEDPIDITEKEAAKTIAQQKLENVDNPVIIRTNIMNNNNLELIIAYAQAINADVVFKPLYPNGRGDIDDQIPSPKRFLKVMEKVWQINGEIRENLSVKSPHYKAWSFQADLQHEIKPEYSFEEYSRWIRRGRVSEVGVSNIHIMPDGRVLPSRYLRKDEYIYGSLLQKDFPDIYEGMADFNEMIFDEERDHRQMKSYPEGYPDLRRRSLAGDPNIFLNKPYPKHTQGGD